MTSIQSVIPSGAQGAKGASAGPDVPIVQTHGPFNGAAGSGSFGDLIKARNAVVAEQPAKSTAQPPADPIAALMALVQSGTPLTTIVDRLATLVAQAAQHALPVNLKGAAADQFKRSVIQSLTNALAPPGTSPPGTAKEQVAALAQRLEQVIDAVARDAEQAGQQSDIAGHILDAKTAKDIPAQQNPKATPSALDAAGLAQTLLAAVASSLASQTSSAQATAPAVPKQAAQTPAKPEVSALVSSSQETSAAATPPAPTTSTMANAPDLLARMLVRAAGVDAQLNGSAPQAARPGEWSSSLTPTQLAAKFAVSLQMTLDSAASNHGNSSGWNSGENAKDSVPSNRSNLSNATTQIGIAGPVQTLVQSPLEAPVATQQAIDPSALIEQMIKGMQMRTNQQGASEIRLHLTPENLGTVSLKLTVSGSQISASVVAQNADVKHALVANHHQLAQSLADAGLTLSGFSVDVSGGDAGQGQNRDRTAGFGKRYVVHEFGLADGEPETTSAAALGPQLLPSTSLGLFNYLA